MTVELTEVVHWLRVFDGATVVIKVGGGLLEPPHRAGLLDNIATLRRLGLGVILVHGGGPQLDALAKRLDIPTERIAGRRRTSPALRDAAVLEWRGRLSAGIVAELAQIGERAMGLCGADGSVLTARRRPPTLMTDDDGTRKTVDFGEVGDVSGVDGAWLRRLLDQGTIPVISPLALGEDGQLLNVNADTVAAHVAAAVCASKLVLVTTAPGILEDPEQPASVLHTTSLEELSSLHERGALQGGMRPKVAAIRHALEHGVERVHVIDGRHPNALIEELFTATGVGTLVTQLTAR